MIAAKHLPKNSALPELFGRPNQFRQRYRWPLVVLVLGASVDFFTTLWNLRKYGTGVEVHLVQRWVCDLLGTDAGMVVSKSLQCLFVLLVAAWWRPWCAALLCVCGLLYAAAALNNYFLWL